MHKKIRIIFFILLIMFGGIIINKFSDDKYVKANNIKNYTEFPKSIIGTWYSYSNDIGVIKMSLTTNKIVVKTNYNDAIYDLKSKNTKDRKDSDIYISSIHKDNVNERKSAWIDIKGFSNNNVYTSYNIFNMDGNKVLVCTIGKYHIVQQQFYKTEHMAKTMSNKHYKGFSY